MLGKWIYLIIMLPQTVSQKSNSVWMPGSALILNLNIFLMAGLIFEDNQVKNILIPNDFLGFESVNSDFYCCCGCCCYFRRVSLGRVQTFQKKSLFVDVYILFILKKENFILYPHQKETAPLHTSGPEVTICSCQIQKTFRIIIYICKYYFIITDFLTYHFYFAGF